MPVGARSVRGAAGSAKSFQIFCFFFKENDTFWRPGRPGSGRECQILSKPTFFIKKMIRLERPGRIFELCLRMLVTNYTLLSYTEYDFRHCVTTTIRMTLWGGLVCKFHNKELDTRIFELCLRMLVTNYTLQSYTDYDFY